jgi:lipopolysaccharide biosynthesis regulator YciM
VAAQLERRGAGSFATRIAHHWCELALEADAKQHAEEADDALRRAREAAPQAPRPRLTAGQVLARRGDPRAAFEAFGALIAANPASFNLIARDYAAAARACGEIEAARTRLQALYERTPNLDLLQALNALEDDAASHERRLAAHLQAQPTLSAAQELLKLQHTSPTTQALREAVTRAARPLQRYRCAACGFEAQHYFWQCPGCLSWDSFPPHRLEDL